MVERSRKIYSEFTIYEKITQDLYSLFSFTITWLSKI